MGTRITFTNEKTLIVTEELDVLARALTNEGSAIVRKPKSERRLAVFAANVTYLEEYDASKQGRVVAF